MDRPEPTTFGPYRVVRKLGSGGMGTVYEAKHELLGRSVAIKTLGERVHLTADSHARFVREARAAAKVRHRNVVQVHDVATQGNVPYMVLELLHGQTLHALLETHVLLSPEKAADLLVPIAAGVAAAHACGIVHRDLKPHNLFIAQEQSSVVPRVLDFGISKFVDEEVPIHTRSDVILGTAQYMSPEQASGSKELDSRSDQYSLAAVLYECVAGRKPFEHDNLYVLINRIAAGDFEPPSAVYSGVPNDLQAVILKAMSRLPSDRYTTTAMFGQALLPFASYKTRLNYAQEFAQFSNAAVTSPFDETELTARHLPSSEASAIPAPQPLAQPRSAPSARQWWAAAALLGAGTAVGYALNRAPSTSSAAAPATTNDSELHSSTLGATPALTLQLTPSSAPHTITPSVALTSTLPALPSSTASQARMPLSQRPSAASNGALSLPPRVTSVAASPSLVQQTQLVPTPTADHTTTDQNRARSHGLVEEDPF